MNNIELPEDLVDYSVNYKKRRILLLICLLVAYAVFVLLTYKSAMSSRYISQYPIIGYIMYAALLILPFYFSGVPHKMFDETYFGTVMKIEIKTTMDSTIPFRPAREYRYRKNTIYLTVDVGNGETIRKAVYAGNAKLGQNLETYNAGDRVLHLCHSKYTVKLPKPNETTVQCPVCGITNDTSADTCHTCGHALPIKLYNTNNKMKRVQHEKE